MVTIIFKDFTSLKRPSQTYGLARDLNPSTYRSESDHSTSTPISQLHKNVFAMSIAYDKFQLSYILGYNLSMRTKDTQW